MQEPLERIGRCTLFFAFLGLAVTLVGCDAPPEPGAAAGSGQQLCATVETGPPGGSAPLGEFLVHLNTGNASGTTPVNSLKTGDDGIVCFESFDWPDDQGTIVNLTAVKQGDERQTLATVLGPANQGLGSVVINEATTVATAYAMARFIDPTAAQNVSGPAPGLVNAVSMAQNFFDPATGAPGDVLTTAPNGSETSTLKSFNSLANMIAACIAEPSSCDDLLSLAQRPNEPTVTSSFQAMASIARSPVLNAQPLFGQSEIGPKPYQPAMVDLPDVWTWTLALRFLGVADTMNGPGNISFDKAGNLFVTNNYTYEAACGDDAVAGSDLLLRFAPDGSGLPPWSGGALYGAGYGIVTDQTGNVWVGNFGFKGATCEDTPNNYDKTVTRFLPDGDPAPPIGITTGNIDQPQGIDLNSHGDIWVTNCGGNSLTKFPGGNAPVNFTPPGLSRPFDVALTPQGNVFVSSNKNHQVVMLDSDGQPTAASPITGGGLLHSMGIASDSQGNVWVSNSLVIDAPCPIGHLADSKGGSLTWIRPDGSLGSETAFEGGGLSIPFGLSVDSEDNVWVANFADQRVSHFCGASCAVPGEPIAPYGYPFDGLQRNTAVQIDYSGNVWVANNWKLGTPELKNPGGQHMVAFVGLGPPRPAP